MRSNVPEGITGDYILEQIHDARARLHHAVPVPQELPQTPVLPARHPDLRETIFQQQPQDQLRILAIRLLFPYPLGSVSAASPTHNSICNSASSRSNQRA
jgi:hypothetical protein